MQVQIARIEVSDALQFLKVEKPERPGFPGDQIAVSQRPDCPVHMDGRKAGGIRDILLSKWELETIVVDQANGFKPGCHFADEMRDATDCVTGGYVADPLTENRCLLEGLAPKYVCEFRRGIKNCLQLRVKDHANTRGADADNVMVEHRQLEGLQIREISGDMKTNNLLALADDFVSGEEAAQ
jgi:hypothetical protein